MMHKAALATIKKHNMLSPGDGIVLGFSGGADSLALLSFLHRQVMYNIVCVHINHGLRGDEAALDAAFCADFCRGIGVSFILFEEDAAAFAAKNGISIEDAGRKLRYARFNQMADNLGFDKIATAHNKNDNAETVLMQIFRGAGAIRGIAPVAGRIVRPLIDIDRNEILAYCRAGGLDFRTDTTNAQNDYARNRLRNTVLPMIKQDFNPSVVDALARLAQISADDEALLDKIAKIAYKNCVNDDKIDIEQFTILETATKRRVVRMLLGRVYGSLRDITFSHIEDVIALLGRQSGKQVTLPNGIIAMRNYHTICIIKPPCHAAFSVVLSKNAPLFVPHLGLWFYLGNAIFRENAFTSALDCDKIDEVKIRTRLPGDKIYWHGVGTKKIKDYFIDKKIPRHIRDAAVFIADGQDIILILEGNRGHMSDKFISSADTAPLYLQIWED